MKKILLLIAAVIILDFILGIIVIGLAWRPVIHFGSIVEVRSGQRMASRHDYIGAIGRYDHALLLDSKNAEAYTARAYAWTYLGRYDAAIADGDQAIQIDPKSGAAYGARGWAREWKGDEDGAHADYNQAIALSPNVAAYYAHRGWVRGRQREWDGALKDLDQALELDPRMASGYHDRAWVKFKQDDLAGALQDENSAVEFGPHQVDYYLRRADLHLRMNDADEALSDARSALDLQPQSTVALYWQAVAQRRLGDMKDSIDSFNQLLQLNPNFSGALFERGMSKYIAGDLAGAEADLKAARASGVDRPFVELWLWIFSCEQGGKADGDQVLSDYLVDARIIKDGTWPEKLGDLMLGRVTPDALAGSLDLAESKSVQEDRLCQLWFFAGKVALLNGDHTTARADFQKAVDTGVGNIIESSEARRELAKL
jgi:lipoprotein NlpI